MSDYNGHPGVDLGKDDEDSGYASAQATQNSGWYQQGTEPQADAGAFVQPQAAEQAQYGYPAGYATGYDGQQYAQPQVQPQQQVPGQMTAPDYQYAPVPPKYAVGPVGMKSKWAAGLLAIFLGSLGVHNFYLGRNGKAVVQLLLTIIGWIFIVGPLVSAIWGFIEGILILTSRPGSPWHKDSSGYELVE